VEALLPVVMFVVIMVKHSKMCFYSYVITILGLRALRLWIVSCQGRITEQLAQQMNDKSTAEPLITHTEALRGMLKIEAMVLPHHRHS